jgi:hypothetical protein
MEIKKNFLYYSDCRYYNTDSATVFLYYYAIQKIGSIMAPQYLSASCLYWSMLLIILLVRNSITVERYIELHFFPVRALFSTLIALFLLFIKTKASLHIWWNKCWRYLLWTHLHYQTQNVTLVLFLILMNGFVVLLRLVMKAHTSTELIIGYF